MLIIEVHRCNLKHREMIVRIKTKLRHRLSLPITPSLSVSEGSKEGKGGGGKGARERGGSMIIFSVLPRHWNKKTRGERLGSRTVLSSLRSFLRSLQFSIDFPGQSKRKPQTDHLLREHCSQRLLILTHTLINHWLSSSCNLTGLFWLLARIAWAVGTRLKVCGLLWSVRACARIAKEEGREAAAIFNAVVISSSVTWTPSKYSRFFSLPRARILKVSG